MIDSHDTDLPASDDPHDDAPTTQHAHGLSRRGLLGLLGAGVGGAAIGAGGFAVAQAAVESSASTATIYPFYGTHQSGVTTPAQNRLHFAAYDMSRAASRDSLIELLQDWSFAASRLMRGLEVTDGGAGGALLAPPADTGEAVGLSASGLTITFGFGPTLFLKDGADRFGIANRKPDELQTLPLFAGDLLEDSLSGGDLCIQACADDPQVAVHAIRNLTRIAFGRAQIRWSQLGFGRTSSTSTAQATPRNLFGFKDGTANIKLEDTQAVTENVWTPSDYTPAWMAGGSYLVARKIRMTIETWDRSTLDEQQRVTGRDKAEGAPLSGGTEFTEPDFAKTAADGSPAIPHDSHVFLAHQQQSGARMLRRGYNFVDGNNELGQLNAGLFFIAFQKSPEQFIAIQRNLAKDAMNEYIRHVGSALFAVPPAARDQNDYVGSGLFA